jgi:hypothetical protein
MMATDATTAFTRASGGDCSASLDPVSEAVSRPFPRIVHVVPPAAPYAQLCVRRVGPTTLNLVAIMVGSGKPNRGSLSGQDAPLFEVGDGVVVDEDDKEFSPGLGLVSSSLGPVSSSQSCVTHDDASQRWACNGWDDLRATVSFSTSSSSSSSSSSSGSLSQNNCNSSQLQGFIWLDEHWFGMNGDSIGDGDAWLLGDDTCLDRSLDVRADAALMEATLCGRLRQTLAPNCKVKSHGSKHDRRHRHSPSPMKRSSKPPSYSVLS